MDQPVLPPAEWQLTLIPRELTEIRWAIHCTQQHHKTEGFHRLNLIVTLTQAANYLEMKLRKQGLERTSFEGYTQGVWVRVLDQHDEWGEVQLAIDYVQHFNHGTDGNIRLVVIAKLANLLSGMAEQLQSAGVNVWDDINPSKPL